MYSSKGVELRVNYSPQVLPIKLNAKMTTKCALQFEIAALKKLRAILLKQILKCIVFSWSGQVSFGLHVFFCTLLNKTNTMARPLIKFRENYVCGC